MAEAAFLWRRRVTDGVFVPVRYLVLEKLKKEDAQRIHVFSSFFYKRLNQRDRRNVPDTTNLP